MLFMIKFGARNSVHLSWGIGIHIYAEVATVQLGAFEFLEASNSMIEHQQDDFGEISSQFSLKS